MISNDLQTPSYNKQDDKDSVTPSKTATFSNQPPSKPIDNGNQETEYTANKSATVTPTNTEPTEKSSARKAPFEEKFDDFPFEVETAGIILSEPPPGLILTTITNSGNLEVITEGPEGIIETELIYRIDGVIEV